MRNTRFSNILPVMALGFGLTACDTVSDSVANLDLDLRNNAGGLDTSDAARNATLDRPAPDSRGVISYPNYQVAVARRGDSVASLSARVGGSAAEIASFNGLKVTDVLGQGEIVALPRSVPVPAVLTQPGAAQPGPVDISGIATSAIDRAPASGGIVRAQPSKRIDGPEPVRHQVKRRAGAVGLERAWPRSGGPRRPIPADPGLGRCCDPRLGTGLCGTGARHGDPRTALSHQAVAGTRRSGTETCSCPGSRSPCRRRPGGAVQRACFGQSVAAL